MIRSRAAKVGLVSVLFAGLMVASGNAFAWDWNKPRFRCSHGDMPKGFLYPIRDHWKKEYKAKGWKPRGGRYSGSEYNGILRASAKVYFYKKVGRKWKYCGMGLYGAKIKTSTKEVLSSTLIFYEYVNGKFIKKVIW